MQEVISVVAEYGIFIALVGIIACCVVGCLKYLYKFLLTKLQKYLIDKAISKRLEEIGSGVVENTSLAEYSVQASNKYGEKWYKGALTTTCTATVAIISILLVCLWYGIYLHEFSLLNKALWTDILASASVSSVIYAIYEKVGVKKLMHFIVGKLGSAIETFKQAKAENRKLTAEEVLAIMKNQGFLFTTSQEEKIKEDLETRLK